MQHSRYLSVLIFSDKGISRQEKRRYQIPIISIASNINILHVHRAFRISPIQKREKSRRKEFGWTEAAS